MDLANHHKLIFGGLRVHFMCIFSKLLDLYWTRNSIVPTEKEYLSMIDASMFLPLVFHAYL